MYLGQCTQYDLRYLGGPSIESLDEIKNLNGTLYVRFINQTLSDSDDDELLSECRTPRAKKPRKLTPAQSSPQKARALTCSLNENKHSLLSKPAAKSLSVTAMLKLGHLIKPKKETIVQVPIYFLFFNRDSNVYFLALFGFHLDAYVFTYFIC